MHTGKTLRLREVRRAVGWSQTVLALKAGLHQSSLSLIERGLVTYVPPVWRSRLAAVLDVPESVLFADATADRAFAASRALRRLLHTLDGGGRP